MKDDEPEDRRDPHVPSLPLGSISPPNAQISSGSGIFQRFIALVVGPARRLSDPTLFHRVSLAAFFAWVGLGADGLSSSAYGPEAAYLALGTNTFLAIPLAILTAITVLIIASSYVNIIKRFPAGGGGYVVASKLLGPTAGLVSGSALIIDYVLTIAISLASCSDQALSILPPAWQVAKIPVTLTLLAILTLLNLRGVRESIAIISPIFLLFIVIHAGFIAATVIARYNRIPAEFTHLHAQSSEAIAQTGWIALGAILFRAFSLGGGTYTGIEAVSNGVPLLREPKIQTARATMSYMGISLALIAAGILLGYLLYEVRPVPGRTLNAVLLSAVSGQYFPPGSHVAHALVALALLTAAALLFVAAQTGFLGGPRVLAYMAADRWVPSRLSHLSERLVTSDGVIVMSIAAALVVATTGAAVGTLVILYSIIVFLTSSLAQLGMCRDALQLRVEGRPWKRGLLISGLGFIATGSLLIGTIVFKFAQGGWATLLTTGLLCLICVAIRRHYHRASVSLARRTELLEPLIRGSSKRTDLPMTRDAPTAIVTVAAFGGIGVHTFLNVVRTFPGHFKQVVFASVGAVDSGQFKGQDALEELRSATGAEICKYVEYAPGLGIPADGRWAIGTDIVDELENLCIELSRSYRRSVAFGGSLIFEREALASRWLHNRTGEALHRRLSFYGLPMVILPARVFR